MSDWVTERTPPIIIPTTPPPCKRHAKQVGRNATASHNPPTPQCGETPASRLGGGGYQWEYEYRDTNSEYDYYTSWSSGSSSGQTHDEYDYTVTWDESGASITNDFWGSWNESISVDEGWEIVLPGEDPDTFETIGVGEGHSESCSGSSSGSYSGTTDSYLGFFPDSDSLRTGGGQSAVRRLGLALAG